MEDDSHPLQRRRIVVELTDKINDLNDFSEIFRRILDVYAMQHKPQPNLSLDGGVGVG